ncbi:MAG: TRAP transporter substrate-binding protein [Proteobacteria bacterium]|nr:TRAP transporter substrate-binding protein [Pseudomonadota bacterium]
MRKAILATLALGAVVATSGTAWAELPTLPPGPKVKIATSTQSLPTIPQMVRVDAPYFKEIIPQKSGGRIEATVQSWAELNLTGQEIIRLVRSGQLDIGGAPLTTVSGDVPLLDGIDLAGLNPDIVTARKVAEAMVPVANKDLEKFNNRIVGVMPYPAQVIWCKKAVTDLADLKGRKIRTFGPSLNDFVLAIGGQPVSVGFPEVYSALERGVAECAVTGTGSGNAAKWFEVTTHIYALVVGWSTGAYFVNVSWWNKLDPAVQAFLAAAIKEMEDKQWALGAEATQDGLDCNTGKAAGCKIHTLVTKDPMTVVAPTEADKAQLKKILSDNVLPGWVKRCGERCGEVYNQVVAPITGVKYAAK